MAYLTAKQFSEIWGITERRIIKLCKENRIHGAIKNGMIWEIPEDTLKPSDKRSNIYKYIHVPKKIMVVNSKEDWKLYLEECIKKQGYVVEYGELEDIQNNLEDISKYYEGIVYFAKKHMDKAEESFIIHFAEKLHSESSIVLVDENCLKRDTIEKRLSEAFRNEIGLRINTLLLDIPENKSCIVNEDEVIEEIVELLFRFKNITGMAIVTDGNKIEFDKSGRTENLEIGKFYRALNHCYKRLNKESYLWCASTMLEDEWTESPQEMKFRQVNLEVANRGVNVERIFIFRKENIKEFKKNKTLKIYMQSNIKTLFVDYDEVKEKEPNLLQIVGAGWDGINKEILIADLPEGSKERGYISQNTKEVMEAYACFQKLKTYSKNLKEVLK